MRNLFKVSLALTVLAYVAASAQAQPRQPFQGGQGRGTSDPLRLLVNKSVSDELKITDDQKKKVEDETKKIDDKVAEKVKDTPRNERFQKMAEVRRELAPEINKAVEGILTTDQQKRFKQVRYQVMGTRAFTSEEVQKELKITDTQKDEIKKLFDALTETRTKAFEGIGFQDREKRAEAQKKVDEATKETEGKVAAALTADQKKTWKEMTGEKFEYKPDQGRRPGGGGTNPPGGTRPPRVDF